MGFIRDLKARHRVAKYLSTAQEQALYALVVEEIAEDKVLPGLWVMAVAESEGNKSKAEGKYLKLRVDMLRGELAISEEVSAALEAEEREQAKAERERAVARRAEEERERKVLTDLPRERRCSQFLEASGYSVAVQDNGNTRTYRVTAPRGASIGLESLNQLERFTNGLRAKAKEG